MPLRPLVACLSSKVLVSTNQVTLRRARLVLGWVTVRLRAAIPAAHTVCNTEPFARRSRLALAPGRYQYYASAACKRFTNYRRP